MKGIGQAYDAGWEQIKSNFGDSPSVVEEARDRLANAVLSVAAEDSRNAEVLARGALEAMVRRYPDPVSLGAPFNGVSAPQISN